MTVHTEAAFEDTIERHLALHGWRSLAPSGYDRALGLFPDELLAFIEESQQKEWEQLKLRLGGEGAARVKVVEHVAKQLDTRGAIKVLRGHIKMNGVTLHTCFFAPANTLTPDLVTRHAQVRCGVVRQLHHSESTPADSLDLALVVNGIPTATAELKNLLTHQGVEHAMAQYQNDRNPADLIFRARVRALRRRPPPGLHDHASRQAADDVPPVQPGRRRSRTQGRCGQPDRSGGARDRIPVGAGLGTLGMARHHRIVRPQQRPRSPVPAIPPVARRSLDRRGDAARRRRNRPPRSALGGLGQVEHHRVDRAPSPGSTTPATPRCSTKSS